MTLTSRRAGQRRRSRTSRTHGSFSNAPRSCGRSSVKNVPFSCLLRMASICARVTCCASPVIATSRSANTGSRTTHHTAPYAASSIAATNSVLATRLRMSGLSHMRRFEYPYAEFVELDAARASSHGNEAVIGHARYRVHFEQIRLTVAIDHHIDAAPAAAPDELKGTQRLPLNAALLLGGQTARADVARVVRQILRLVVIESARCFESNQRQRLPIEYRGSDFHAFDEALAYDHVVVLGCELVSGCEFFNGSHLAHSDAGAFARGLHHDRHPEPLRERYEIRVFAEHGVWRCRHA